MYVRVVDLPGLNVGDRVFVVVTPKTHHVFLQHFRPKPYFVLETHITEIVESRRGEVYLFATDFAVFPGLVFRKLCSAKVNLVQRFTEETGGVLVFDKVHFVSAEEERAGTDAINKEIEKYIARP